MNTKKVLALGFVLMCSGCVVFDHDFDLAARRPVDAAEPAAGAWEGTWTSTKTPYRQAAKAIISRRDDGMYKISMALWGRDGIWEEADVQAVVMKQVADGAEEFECTYPLPDEGNYLQLSGKVSGDWMTINYEAHDGSGDSGTIELKRAKK